jgi:acetyl esterase/lipase
VVVHGSLDTVVPTEYGRAFVQAAVASGDDVTLVELPDIQHFGLIDPLSSAWSDVSEGLASLTGRGRG